MRALLAMLALVTATAAANPRPSEHFDVTFYTNINGTAVSPRVATNGSFTLRVYPTWAPKGAAQLKKLLSYQTHFFDGAAFFRVVPNFVVQFGIAAVPGLNTQWQTPITDDPVVASNTRGTVTYATAGPNTRTTQLFVNYANNSFLDSQGFAPFGEILGMADAPVGTTALELVPNPTPGNSNGVSQSTYTSEGNGWLQGAYPQIAYIVRAFLNSEPVPPRPPADSP